MYMYMYMYILVHAHVHVHYVQYLLLFPPPSLCPSLPQEQAGLRSSLPHSAAQLSDAIQELLNLIPGQRQFQEALKKMREVSNSVETGQVRGREER